MDQALGATTPEVPVVPDAGQPTQPMGGTPEGQQLAPEAQAPETQEQWIELPSGSRYRTTDDLIRGATEKDFTILRLKEQLAQQQSQSFAPPQQQMPMQTAPTVDETLVQEFVMAISSDPDFKDASPAEIRAEAKLQAIAAQKIIDRTLGRVEQTATQKEWRSFVDSTPELQTPLAQHIYEQAKMQGRPFNSPQEHLTAVRAELYLQSQRGPSPTSGVGVQGAMQAATQRQQVFSNPTGGGIPQQGAPLSERVQRAVEEGRKMGFDDAALERVKQRAIENEARMAHR